MKRRAITMGVYGARAKNNRWLDDHITEIGMPSGLTEDIIRSYNCWMATWPEITGLF